jgi:hypothetical protein
MDNPLLIPIAGGLAIVLLLGLLLVLRRRANRPSPEAETAVDGEHGAEGDAERDDAGELLPMLSHDDASGSANGESDAAESDEESDEDVEVLEPLHAVDAWGDPVPPGPEPVNVRYLRAQVRTLQEALESVQDVPDHGGVDMARFRRQVSAALRGLGERTREDESPERTLARVVAAIERLDAPDEVARPVLPSVKFDLSGAQMTLAGPQYVVAPAALNRASVVTMPAPAPAAPAPAAAAPAPAPEAAPAMAAAVPEAPAAPAVTTPLASALAAGAVDEDRHAALGLDTDPFAQDEQYLAPPADPDVVLPVPPPSVGSHQRPRRWSRRHGA